MFILKQTSNGILYIVFSDVKDLISKCLSLKSTERPSLEDLLQHPWMLPADAECDTLQVPSDNRALHGSAGSTGEM